MSTPSPLVPTMNNDDLPVIRLYPLNDAWAPRDITLGTQRVVIGRQCIPPETHPEAKNGYFDSKVLSRQHAEVWQEIRKIYIKDTKSVNGTFLNGERLSAPGHESDPFELKSDDILEFGVDVLAEDKHTILHHKIVARVVCAV